MQTGATHGLKRSTGTATVTVDDLADATGLSPSSVTIALEALRARGFALSGQFEPERGEQWCARRRQSQPPCR